MFEQLSIYSKVSVVFWLAFVVFFGPRVYKSWQGRRRDWIELTWLVYGLIAAATTVFRPDLKEVATGLIFFPLVALTLLDSRSRKS